MRWRDDWWMLTWQVGVLVALALLCFRVMP